MKKIDTTDTTILKALLEDSRTSFTQIARDLRISITAVIRRYKRLKKTGLIAGEIMQVNPASFGYECVADVGIITAIGKEKEVRDKLSKKPRVLQSIGFGEFSILALVTLPRIADLSEMLREISSYPHVLRAEPIIWAKTTEYFHIDNLQLEPHPLKTKPGSTEKTGTEVNTTVWSQLKREQLDEIDLNIARIVSQNSRMAFTQIAEKVGVSTKKAIERYERLRRGNVLTNPSISLDLTKFGYVGMAYAFIKLENKSTLPETHDQLLQIPNMLLSCERIGDYDLSLFFVLRNLQDLFSITEKVHRTAGIERVQIHPAPVVPYWPVSIFAPCLSLD